MYEAASASSVCPESSTSSTSCPSPCRRHCRAAMWPPTMPAIARTDIIHTPLGQVVLINNLAMGSYIVGGDAINTVRWWSHHASRPRSNDMAGSPSPSPFGHCDTLRTALTEVVGIAVRTSARPHVRTSAVTVHRSMNGLADLVVSSPWRAAPSVEQRLHRCGTDLMARSKGTPDRCQSLLDEGVSRREGRNRPSFDQTDLLSGQRSLYSQVAGV